MASNEQNPSMKKLLERGKQAFRVKLKKSILNRPIIRNYFAFGFALICSGALLWWRFSIFTVFIAIIVMIVLMYLMLATPYKQSATSLLMSYISYLKSQKYYWKHELKDLTWNIVNHNSLVTYDEVKKIVQINPPEYECINMDTFDNSLTEFLNKCHLMNYHCQVFSPLRKSNGEDIQEYINRIATLSNLEGQAETRGKIYSLYNEDLINIYSGKVNNDIMMQVAKEQGLVLNKKGIKLNYVAVNHYFIISKKYKRTNEIEQIGLDMNEDLLSLSGTFTTYGGNFMILSDEKLQSYAQLHFNKLITI
jgi:hypothetical protein